MVSHRATTTIKVTRREDLDPDTYFELIADAHRDQGYVTTELMKDPEVNEWLRDITDELRAMAERFEAGTVLERRGDFLYVRRTLEPNPS